MVTAESEKDLTQGEFVYVLKGDPIPLARARMGSRCLYDGQKNHKLMLGIELSKQHGLRDLYEGPIALDFVFFFRCSKKNLPKLRGKPHYYKPDISNLIKFYEDISSKILFHDDCLIAQITARKVYDDNPRTEFTIRRL